MKHNRILLFSIFCFILATDLQAQDETDYSDTMYAESDFTTDTISYDEFNETTEAQQEPEWRNRPYNPSGRDTQNLSRKKWERLKEELDWSERKKKKKKIEEKESPLQPKVPEIGMISAKWLKVLLFAILGGVILYLLYRLLAGRWQQNKNNSLKIEQLLEEGMEEAAMQSDLDRWLAQAEAIPDYRLSTRILFLQLLKTLRDNNQIAWRREKTNRDYLLELFNQPHYQEIADLTRQYEKIWYGEYTLERTAYLELKLRFEQCQKGVIAK
jgi:hypothetical protein